MNSGRRASHRRLILFLAPIAGIVVIAGYAVQTDSPRVPKLPSFATDSRSALGSFESWGDALWVREDLFPNWPARVTAYSGRRFALKPLRALEAPDVLLYWSSLADSGSGLPSDAHLLGKLGGTGIRRFVLPEHGIGEEKVGGMFVLYSLGHQEVVARASLPSFVEGPTATSASDEGGR